MPTALEWLEIIQSIADRTPTPGQADLPPDISVPRGLTAGEDLWEEFCFRHEAWSLLCRS